ncbi:cytochrome d ubiquinol oxidase subunit II [Antrihabitans cavernicola]|uniref:Cytochrome d ubiquinol oxidase subunit II n=1 Tax=Antrihabitans cavernicola TaxID=2495913 RepID=A0A5A7SC84_9NOCA|nr:cytochrome d ubiquinol oxidase subunit II [Spelaeibacter cavernicola]KAA0021861.1 cytochrome d ubiquinol oxidase subunit II [Spelaeibacter cavernicola]
MGIHEAWFVVIAFLFLGYFVLEGFDFGVGMLMPILGRGAGSEKRRRVVLNTIGPVWDGNEVWLITALGALFAAFPEWYATLLSGFYLPFLVLIVSLILRVCAIEYRGKIDDPVWRARCDAGIGIGSWIPAVLWGVVLANLIRGVAVDSDKQVTGGLLDLFSPYALLGGLTTALLFALHGAVFIALKTADEVRVDAGKLAVSLAVPAVVVTGAWALWTQLAYGKGWTWIALGLVLAALAIALPLARAGREGWAFGATAAAVASLVVLVFGSMFPNVLPSTIDSAFDLTIHNASSSAYTLRIMSWAALFTAPVVIGYQAWTYWVFRQRISMAHIPPPIGLRTR